MLRAVLTLFEKWELSERESLNLLGGISPRSLQRWRAGAVPALSNDMIFRLSELLGIHSALRHIFPDLRNAYSWIKRPNDTFGGRSALDLMLQGSPIDISRVRAYLDAEQNGW